MDFGISKFRRLLFVSCIGLASTNLIDLTDTMIAGNLLGETALSAMNLFWPCVDFQFFVCMAIASGTAILYSRAAGAFDADRASKIFSNGLVLAVLTGAGLGLGYWLLRGPAEVFYGVSGKMGALLTAYWNVFVFEVLIFPAYVFLNTMVASDGDTTVGTASFLVELLVNAVASYFLCKAYGIAGCAMGSIVSTLAGLAVTSIHFFKDTNSFVFQWYFSLKDSLGAFCADLPEASVSLFSAVVYAVMNKVLIVDFGESALPVMTAVVATNGFALFLYGVPPAAQPIVGVYRVEGNFGAVRRVMRSALGTSLLLGCMVGTFFALFPSLPVRLIGIVSPEVSAQACQAVRIVAFSYPFVAVTALFTAYYLYIERIGLSLALVALQSAVLPLSFSAAGAVAWGESGFWFGYMVATPFAVLVFFLVLKAFMRDRLEAPPWFLDLTRNVYASTWTLRTEPTEICRVAEEVQKRLEHANAPAATLAKAAFMVEDMLMQIRSRNQERAVLAEVLLDVYPDNKDKTFARIILRDDGVVDEKAAVKASADDAFRGEMLDAVMEKLKGRQSRVTTGFNRQEFLL